MIKSLFYLILLLPSFSWSRGGDFVNNGGGLAEKNILYAFEKMDVFIQNCLSSPRCRVNEPQKNILKKILAGIAQEKKSTQIIVASETKTPGQFMIDGLVRVAKTGNTVGTPIYVNSDLLYTKNVSGGYDAITIPEAVAILIHELGHHYGKESHSELDLVGVNVSVFLQQKLILTPMIPWAGDISASVFNPDFNQSYPEILLNVGSDSINLSSMYRQAVECFGVTIPIIILPLPDLQLMSSQPLGSLLHNIHWESFEEADGWIWIKMIGNISNRCQYNNDVGLRNNDYKLAIEFAVQKNEDSWIFVQNSASMSQYRDPWYKWIRLPLDLGF